MIKELADYHIHSRYSFDSKEKIENICEKAIDMGLSEICMTEHFSVLDYDPSYDFFEHEKYRKDIDETKEKYKFPIKRGLEIGEGHIKKQEIKKIIDKFDLDFIIGSIHNIGTLTLRKSLHKYGEEETYKRYFEEVKNIAAQADYDVLGHLDLVQRYAMEEFHSLYNLQDYERQISEILEIIIERGKGIEVNTSSLYKEYKKTFPRLSILKTYYSMGGRIITVGSDAHKSNRVGEGIKEVYEILASVGFSSVAKFSKRSLIM
ncbi:histidinol-phosphatase HisJ family protein [Haloimpatiens massiliensis]|uniref:histidinol-phosphatase HisJ family protein n=1 Tax=Haloimpatiens massiliensis TaxID=1658110 RepID=UPI001FA8C438|nr:histidinol-phosphatase HisJ family protein [Haloimpatiens massiliensis]